MTQKKGRKRGRNERGRKKEGEKERDGEEAKAKRSAVVGLIYYYHPIPNTQMSAHSILISAIILFYSVRHFCVDTFINIKFRNSFNTGPIEIVRANKMLHRHIHQQGR